MDEQLERDIEQVLTRWIREAEPHSDASEQRLVETLQETRPDHRPVLEDARRRRRVWLSIGIAAAAVAVLAGVVLLRSEPATRELVGTGCPVGVSGTVYVSAGNAGNAANLYRLTFCPLRAEHIDGWSIAGVGASQDLIVVKSGSGREATTVEGEGMAGVRGELSVGGVTLLTVPDGTDLLAPERFRSISTPSVGPDGRIALGVLPDDGGWELRVIDPRDGSHTTLATEPISVEKPAWIPDGRIAFLSRRTDGTTNIRIVGLHGISTTTSMPIRATFVRAVGGLADGRIAIGHEWPEEHMTLLIDPEEGTVEREDTWILVAASPDGQWLLANTIDAGGFPTSEFALVSASRLDTLYTLGRFPHKTWHAAWAS